MKLKNNVRLRESNGQSVILDMKSGGYWQLNVTGSIIVSELVAGASIEEIIDMVASVSDIDSETARRDCVTFINELAGAGLLDSPSGR